MPELLLVNDAVWVWMERTQIGIYDFDFRSFFPCRQPWKRRQEVIAIARCGAVEDYAAEYDRLLERGIRLVHSDSQHRRASQLSEWYPLLKDLTPRSRVYKELPGGEEVAKEFAFPVFVKGTRQTSRHRKSLSIARTAEEFDVLMVRYRNDAILNWQPVVVRELIPLRLVESNSEDRIDSSFEFRTFWWKGKLVGAGRYWWEGRAYPWSKKERSDALKVGQATADRLNVPFLVVDVAMTAEGRWIVIECNDGQESGYAGVSPLGLWQNIIDIERTREI